MANSEKAKIKTLVLYDYFLKTLNPDDPSSRVQMSDILTYLREVLETDFERKSVYSDIDRLNEFVYETGLTESREWISKTTPKSNPMGKGGKFYERSALKTELSDAEAHLVFDAIRTTSFVDSGVCEKIMKIYPMYFKDEEKVNLSSLISKETKSSKRNYIIPTIRYCIENSVTLLFNYGYKMGPSVVSATRKTVSPIGLDWENDNYYLIALDNELAKKASGDEAKLFKTIKRYRIDRMTDPTSVYSDETLEYFAPKDNTAKKKLLDKYISNSLNAFQSENGREVEFVLTAEDDKNLIKAFSYISDELNNIRNIQERRSTHEIRFMSHVAPVPPLFKLIFSIFTFDGVKLEVRDEEIKSQFKSYMNRINETLD